MKRLVVLLVLALLGSLAWTQRALLRSGLERIGFASAEPAVSPALARRAEERLAALKKGKTGSVTLHQNELQSLVQFRYRERIPSFVDSPTVELEGGRIRVRARVPVDRLPSISELGEAAGFLPDTTEVDLTGQLLPLDSGRIALAIDQVRAARIPLPQRLVPRALNRLGRRDEPGLPADALALPLPPGVATAYVRGDSLVLLARPIPRSTR